MGSVSSPTATHFSISAPGSRQAGDSFSITVTVQDSSNHTVTGYTGTVHFTSSDGSAALPGDYTFTSADNGTHTFNVILKTAGSQTIRSASAVAPMLRMVATNTATAR